MLSRADRCSVVQRLQPSCPSHDLDHQRSWLSRTLPWAKQAGSRHCPRRCPALKALETLMLSPTVLMRAGPREQTCA